MAADTLKDWIAILKQVTRDLALPLRSAQKATLYRSEYTQLFVEILDQLLEIPPPLNEVESEVQQWARDAAHLLPQVAATLGGDGPSVEAASDENEMAGWQSISEAVKRLLGFIDEFPLPGIGQQRDVWQSLPAPPRLFQSTLSNMMVYKDQLAHFDRLNHVRERLGPWMNTNRLRRWLSHCDTHHSTHCAFSPEDRGTFPHYPRRLVDVQHMCLVPYDRGQQYVALSYVWGVDTAFKTSKSNHNALMRENSLSLGQGSNVVTPLALPKTIEHAIELTRRLEQKFLWVDALCILQDDDNDMQHELGRMGSIYANAYVTLVAAGGTATNGLRGIKEKSLPMARIAEMPLHRTHGRMDDTIRWPHRMLQVSAWSNRAWTFQEQIFSRRLLVLFDGLVAWECHCAVWLEDMDVVEGHCQKNTKGLAANLSFGLQPSLDEYAQHVTEFNHRQLTYPQDALDAFGGILGVLSDSTFEDGFVCGLPTRFFDCALLWYNSIPLARRSSRQKAVEDQPSAPASFAPSWTWAGWSGRVEFLPHTSTVGPEQIMSARPLVQWKYKASIEESWKTINSDYAQSTATTSTVSEPTLASISSNVLPLLFTQAARAFFPVAAVMSNIHVALGHTTEEYAGTLISTSTLDKEIERPNSRCEVVVVSEPTATDEDVYNVLWIGRAGGMAYRKGVGRVLKTAWKTSKTESVDLVLK